MAVILSLCQRGGFSNAQALNITFLDAWSKLGLEDTFVVCDPNTMNYDNTNRLLSCVDGVLFPGDNVNFDPSLYGENPDTSLDEYERSRHQKEIEFLKQAKNHQLPILGVCRGQQAMNILLGGKLKDVSDHMGEENNDPNSVEPVKPIRHDITIDTDSLLYSIVQETTISVNSYHQQGFTQDNLSFYLKGVAVSHDTVIEAVELRFEKYPFFLGVQWHPEKAPEEVANSKILSAFSEACSIYRAKHH